MTNEEMERAIEFLLKSQAGFEARQASFEAQLAQTNQQVIQTNVQVIQTSQQVETLTQKVDVMVQQHEDFSRYVRSFLEAQSEVNQSLRETVRALTISQARTDERLNNLERGTS